MSSFCWPSRVEYEGKDLREYRNDEYIWDFVKFTDFDINTIREFRRDLDFMHFYYTLEKMANRWNEEDKKFFKEFAFDIWYVQHCRGKFAIKNVESTFEKDFYYKI